MVVLKKTNGLCSEYTCVKVVNAIMWMQLIDQALVVLTRGDQAARDAISILILLMKLHDGWHWVALDRHPVAPMQEV